MICVALYFIQLAMVVWVAAYFPAPQGNGIDPVVWKMLFVLVSSMIGLVGLLFSRVLLEYFAVQFDQLSELKRKN